MPPRLEPGSLRSGRPGCGSRKWLRLREALSHTDVLCGLAWGLAYMIHTGCCLMGDCSVEASLVGQLSDKGRETWLSLGVVW